MSESSNRNLVLQLADCLSRGHIDEIADLLDPDLLWRSMRRIGASAMTKDQLIAALKSASALMKEGVYRFWITGIISEGDRVAAEAEGFGTLPDGRIYQQIYHMLYIFRDGRILEAREYYDSAHGDDTILRFYQAEPSQ